MTNKTKATAPQIPIKPEPLSPYHLHTPAVQRAHDAAMAAYWDEVHAIERRQAEEAAAAKAYANRVLNKDEQYEEALQRQAEQRARDLERDVAALAAKNARDEFLATTAPTVDVCETSFFTFLRTFEHFAGRGYTLDINGPQTIVPPNFFHVAMVRKPTKAKVAA